MIDAIDTTDWEAVPGPADHYRPAAAREGLHRLARAHGLTDAATAASLLAGGGIIHDHSGTVLPAAVPATPILLRIAEEGPDAVRAAALELVEDALIFRPRPGFTRTQEAVRLCCAIANHVHAHGPALAELGGPSSSLLATARGHWRVDVEEACAEGTDTLVFGTVPGSLPGFSPEVELHAGGQVVRVGTMAVEYPVTEGQAQVCVRLADTKLPRFRTGASLYSGSCGTQQSDL